MKRLAASLLLVSLAVFPASCDRDPIRPGEHAPRFLVQPSVHTTYFGDITITDLGHLGAAPSRAIGITDGGKIWGNSAVVGGGTRGFEFIDVDPSPRAIGFGDNVDGWIENEAADLAVNLLGSVRSPSGSWTAALRIPDHSEWEVLSLLPGSVGSRGIALTSPGVAGTSFMSGGATRATLWSTEVIDLGTLGGESSEVLDGAAGQVVGRAQLADGTWRGYLWVGGSMRELPGGDPRTASVANGISPAGVVAGAVHLSGVRVATIWEGGVAVPLPGLAAGADAEAVAINAQGVAVGWAKDGGGVQRAVLWTRDNSGWVARDLGGIGGGSAAAFAINGAGQIVGESTNAAGEVHATRWSVPLWASGPPPLPVFTDGYDWSWGVAVDTDGNAYGVIDSTNYDGGDVRGRVPVVWMAEGGPRRLRSDLATLLGVSSDFEWFSGASYSGPDGYPGSTPALVWRRDGQTWSLPRGQARDVNRAGVAVGHLWYGDHPVNPPDSTKAFVWTSAEGTRLLPGTPAAPGRPMCSANAINDGGMVVGQCGQRDDQLHAVVWNASDNAVKDVSVELGLACARFTKVNAAGEVIGTLCGTSGSRPFRWNAADGLRLLPLPAGVTAGTAHDINRWGDIVGTATVAGEPRGILWVGGGDRIILLPVRLVAATGINDAGHIVGEVRVAGLEYTYLPRAARLAPVVPRDDAPPPANLPPLASTEGPYDATTVDAVQFDARASSDPEGQMLTYWWDFGDGTGGSSPTPSHTYQDTGTFQIVLEVRDPLGLVGRATTSATIARAPGSPTAVVNGPYEGTEGAPTAFNAAGSSDPEGGALTYAWDFGDGTTGTGYAPGHMYRQDGTYQVSLRVTNARGISSPRTFTTAVIADVPPKVHVTGSTVRWARQDTLRTLIVGRDQTLRLWWSITDPGWDGPYAMSIDWGDGSAEPATDANVPHVYASPGTYTVTLTVRGTDGITGQGSLAVSVLDDAPPVASAGPAYSVNEGMALSLDGTASQDPEGGPLTFRWSVRNSVLTGASPTHVFADDQVGFGRPPIAVNTVDVWLVVWDQHGLPGEAHTTVEVHNVAPSVELSPSTPQPAPGAPFSLGLRFRDPGPLDAPWTYVIDWGDGSAATTGRIENSVVVGGVGEGSATLSHTYSTLGARAIAVTLRDRDGGIGKAETSVTVSGDQLPVAAPGGPYAGVEGSAVQLSGMGSHDPQGGPLAYQWDFGDGSTATGASVAHVYADQGTYAATLRVIDVDGLTGTATTTVVVSNKAPAVVIRTPASTPILLHGQSFTLEAGFSDAGANDGPWSYSIDWGDGSDPLTGPASSQSVAIAGSHAYTTAGTYTVRVTVQDKDLGAGSKTLSVTVRSDGQLPTVNPGGPYTGNEGTSFTLSSAGSVDPDGGTLTYKWSFGDGTTSTSANPSKKYADNGTYTVTLTAKDPSGLTNTATTTATIANVAPTATVATTNSVGEGNRFGLALNPATDLSSADVAAGFEYAYDCADGAGYGAWSRNIFATCGPYPDNVPSTRLLRAKLRDKDLAEREYTRSITILDVAPAVQPVTLVSPLGTGAGTSASPLRIRSGDPVRLAGAFSDNGLLDAPWTIKWVWGDGTSSTSTIGAQGAVPEAKHVFVKPGLLRAYLQVTDKDAKYGRSAQFYIQVDSLPVTIDVVPGSSPNVIDLDAAANATIPVAVFSTATLDATKLSYLRLGNGSGTEASTSGSASHRDVDGDGRLDLVANFSRSTLISNGDLSTASTQLVLIGTHADGRRVRGIDAVQVVP